MKKLILLISLISSLLLSQIAYGEEFCECICETNIDISMDLEIISLYPNPIEGEVEWINIKNTGDNSIHLSNYTLEDSTQNPWTIPDQILAAQTSIQIEGFSFQLNNGGDEVTLKTINGELIDELIYTDSEPEEIIQKSNSSIENPDVESDNNDETVEEIQTPELWPDFSEALPNPEGTDSSEEWIELFNPFDQNLNLEGLYLDDQEGGSSKYQLEGTIASYDFLLVSIEDSGITLNNSIDSIRLLGVNDEVLWEVEYENPKENESLIQISDSEQVWTSILTPGTANEYADPNSEDDASEYENGDLSEDVELNEVYPNPEGADANDEWVELTNGGDEPVNLGNWVLDDGDGGSDPFILPDDTIIQPGETLILYRTETGIALNNSNETIELIDHSGEVVDEISYEKSEEGLSLAKIEVQEGSHIVASLDMPNFKSFFTWEWVKPSPGELNPQWRQFTGTVEAFDGQTLSLNNGIETLEFKAETKSQVDDWLYQNGNTILVNTSLEEGIYYLKNTELIKQFTEEIQTGNSRAFPVEWLISTVLLASWFAIDLYKKRRQKHRILKPIHG